MKRTKITDFENYRLANAYIRFEEKGVLQDAEPLGCVGSLSMEPEISNVSKKCGGRNLKQTNRTESITVTIEAHVNPNTAIEVLGLTPDGLKPGVYGYNGEKTPRGNMVCSVFDMYDEVEKLIAFPNITFNGGLSMSISSGEDEVAMLELPVTALIDDNGFFYYQAFVEDLTEEDADLEEKWRTQFSPEIVAKAPGVGGM